MEPTVSIVTVTLNNLGGLQRTFESIRDQNYARIEHVIVDGGSTDGTVEWLETHSAVRDTMVISEQDSGIFDAMNKGIQRCSGSLIAFMNAGDAYCDGSAVSRAAESYAKSRWTWGYGLAENVDSSGRQVRTITGLIPYRNWRHAMGFRAVCHQGVFIRRSTLVEVGGFDVKFGNVADYHLLVKLGRHHHPVIWPTVIVSYLAGGISEEHLYRSLWWRHSARREALGLGRAMVSLDALWTMGQVVVASLRRSIRKLASYSRIFGLYRRWIDWDRRRRSVKQKSEAVRGRRAESGNRSLGKD